MELGSICNYFQGFGEQAHSFGDLGSPAKSKKYHLKGNAFISFIYFFLKNLRLLGKSPPDPLGKSKCINFRATRLIRIGIGV